MQNLQQNSRYISHQSDHQKALKTDKKCCLSNDLNNLNKNKQAPISQAAKKEMNTKVNKERPGSTFKMPSRTKSPIRTKQSNAQGSTKPLKRTYGIESMDSDTVSVVASLNLKEIISNYNTWNQLTVGKLLSSITFLNVPLLHIIRIYLDVCKQMTGVKFLLLHINSRDNLTVSKQMRKSK